MHAVTVLLINGQASEGMLLKGRRHSSPDESPWSSSFQSGLCWFELQSTRRKSVLELFIGTACLRVCFSAESDYHSISDCLQLLDPALSHYRDRRFPGTQEQFEQRLTESTTLYIGNLYFYTTEEQVYEVADQLVQHIKTAQMQPTVSSSTVSSQENDEEHE